MDLIHTHWTLTIRPWTVLYPSKRGPVLNVFLCYLRSPGHNRKTRTSSFGSVFSFPLLLHTQVFVFRCLQTRTPPNTHPHTPHTKQNKQFTQLEFLMLIWRVYKWQKLKVNFVTILTILPQNFWGKRGWSIYFQILLAKMSFLWVGLWQILGNLIKMWYFCR